MATNLQKSLIFVYLLDNFILYIININIKNIGIKLFRKGKKMKKNNNKGFTLIELLVVVAIIGALAAVGVVAYNGYTAAAKKNSAKAIHSNMVKYVASELAKCNLDEQPFGSISCPASRDSVITLLVGDTSPIKDKNPFSSTSAAVTSATVASSTDKSNLGWTSVTSSGTDDIVFSTWYDNDEDMLESTVSVE